MGPFAHWQTFDLGRFVSVDVARRQLDYTGCNFRKTGADALLDCVTFRKFSYVVQVADVTLEELELTQGTRVPEILARAREAELDLCPDELGPELALRHDIFNRARKASEADDVVHLGMRPLKSLGGAGPFVFRVRVNSGGGKSLEICPISLGFKPTDRFLFLQKFQA